MQAKPEPAPSQARHRIQGMNMCNELCNMSLMLTDTCAIPSEKTTAAGPLLLPQRDSCSLLESWEPSCASLGSLDYVLYALSNVPLSRGMVPWTLAEK